MSMDWIQTYRGIAMRPLDAAPETIDIRDIAHALSLQCRFNGHCRVFYSVADHSVHVSRIVPEAHALWGLLHDAAEAYVCDLPRPLKHQIPAYVEIEDRLLEVIVQRFGLSWPMPPEVREADDILLATEQRDMMEPPPAPWGLTAQPLDAAIDPLDPAQAEAAFLQRYEALTRR